MALDQDFENISNNAATDVTNRFNAKIAPGSVRETGGMLATEPGAMTGFKPLSGIPKKPDDLTNAEPSKFFQENAPNASIKAPDVPELGRGAPRPWDPNRLNFQPEASSRELTGISTKLTGMEAPTEGLPTQGDQTKPDSGFGRFGEGISGGFTEPETAATKAGDAAARSRIMGEARASGEAGMQRASNEYDRGMEEKARAKKSEEFDFSNYQTALSALGGKPSLKTRMSILSHMMGEHEKRQELTRKYKEMEMAHGEGSASMVQARSEAKHRDIDSQLKMAKEPAEVGKLLAEKGKLIAETQKVPAEIGYMNAHAAYMEANSDSPMIKGYKVQLDNITKQLGEAIGNPKLQEELTGRARDIYEAMNKDAHAHEMSKKYGLPRNPKLNQTHEIPGQGTVKWNGQSWVEAK